MVKKTIELAEAHGWFMTRQFENEANPDFHSRTTAREIIDDFAGDRLDFWVTGYGTGGTLKGVGRVLRKERPETKIIVCEPADAPLLESGIEQKRIADGSPAEPHPSFKPHPMQGWTPDFIPKLTGDAVDMKLIDRVLPISGADAIRWSKELAAKEGIFVGITSGGTFAGALKIAAEAPKGANILCMLPDTGERYLSTPLFADVPVEMTEEELAILRSIPARARRLNTNRFATPSRSPSPSLRRRRCRATRRRACRRAPEARRSASPECARPRRRSDGRARRRRH